MDWGAYHGELDMGARFHQHGFKARRVHAARGLLASLVWRVLSSDRSRVFKTIHIAVGGKGNPRLATRVRCLMIKQLFLSHSHVWLVGAHDLGKFRYKAPCGVVDHCLVLLSGV